jgi:hypothetical protein
MKIYDNGFIGHNESSVTLKWAGSDTLENFVKNKKNMPYNWYYNTNSFTYERNSLGHRSKEIKDLDFDNYILFVGCSHTEGIGVRKEDTFPEILSGKLKCDYYNMGLGGTGMDVTMHNLIIWFSVFSKKPKAVVIQWPDFTRVLTGTSHTALRPLGFWHHEEDYNKFVDLGITIEYFEAKKIMANHIVKNMITVPKVYFGIKSLVQFDDSTLIEKSTDKGRDLQHPGIKSHERFAESIHDYLINTLCLSFCQNPEEKS